ncbi:MAG: hypothetical protein ACOCU8_01885 [Patescibacteria group bacterium]
MKRYILFLLIIACLVVIGLWWLNSKTVEEKELKTDFDQIGNLIIDNPGLLPGEWYLSYETEGQPGMLIKLNFSEDSLCFDNNDYQISCFLNDEEIGTRVQVIGQEVEDGINVFQLNKL